MSTTLPRYASRCLLGAVLATGPFAMTACGSDDDGGSTSTTTTSSAPVEANAPTTSATEQPSDKPADAGSVSMKEFPVGDGGPKGVKTWFYPAGAKMVDLGGAFNGSLQFGLSGMPSDQIVAAYAAELKKRGYQVSENYKAKVGSKELDVALGWKGDGASKPYGTVTDGKLAGITVSITERPSDLAPK